MMLLIALLTGLAWTSAFADQIKPSSSILYGSQIEGSSAAASIVLLTVSAPPQPSSVQPTHSLPSREYITTQPALMDSSQAETKASSVVYITATTSTASHPTTDINKQSALLPVPTPLPTLGTTTSACPTCGEKTPNAEDITPTKTYQATPTEIYQATPTKTYQATPITDTYQATPTSDTHQVTTSTVTVKTESHTTSATKAPASTTDSETDLAEKLADVPLWVWVVVGVALLLIMSCCVIICTVCLYIKRSKKSTNSTTHQQDRRESGYNLDDTGNESNPNSATSTIDLYPQSRELNENQPVSRWDSIRLSWSRRSSRRRFSTFKPQQYQQDTTKGNAPVTRPKPKRSKHEQTERYVNPLWINKSEPSPSGHNYDSGVTNYSKQPHSNPRPNSIAQYVGSNAESPAPVLTSNHSSEPHLTRERPWHNPEADAVQSSGQQQSWRNSMPYPVHQEQLELGHNSVPYPPPRQPTKQRSEPHMIGQQAWLNSETRMHGDQPWQNPDPAPQLPSTFQRPWNKQQPNSPVQQSPRLHSTEPYSNVRQWHNPEPSAPAQQQPRHQHNPVPSASAQHQQQPRHQHNPVPIAPAQQQTRHQYNPEPSAPAQHQQQPRHQHNPVPSAPAQQQLRHPYLNVRQTWHDPEPVEQVHNPNFVNPNYEVRYLQVPPDSDNGYYNPMFEMNSQPTGSPSNTELSPSQPFSNSKFVIENSLNFTKRQTTL